MTPQRGFTLIITDCDSRPLKKFLRCIQLILPFAGKNVRGSGHKDSAHSNWNSSMNKGNAGGGGGSGLGGGINRANGNYVVYNYGVCV